MRGYQVERQFVGGPWDGCTKTVSILLKHLRVLEPVPILTTSYLDANNAFTPLPVHEYVLDDDSGIFFWKGANTNMPPTSKRPTSADIDLLSDGRLKLICQYDPVFVDRLKQEIPMHKREWKPKPDAYWAIDASYLDMLVKMCEEFYSQVRLLFGNAAEDDPFSALFLYPEAPDDLIRAAYKCLALLYHPDRANGNHQKMSDLNTAYAAIKTQKGWK